MHESMRLGFGHAKYLHFALATTLLTLPYARAENVEPPDYQEYTPGMASGRRRFELPFVPRDLHLRKQALQLQVRAMGPKWSEPDRFGRVMLQALRTIQCERMATAKGSTRAQEIWHHFFDSMDNLKGLMVFPVASVSGL